MNELIRKAKMNHGQAGFTLFELLAVLAIFLTVLATASFVSQKFKQHIADQQCLMNAESFARLVDINSSSYKRRRLSPDNVLPGWDSVCDELFVDKNGTVNWAASNLRESGDSGIIVTNPEAIITANPPASGN